MFQGRFQYLLLAAALAVITACGGGQAAEKEYPLLDDESSLNVQILSDQQLQMGYQIDRIVSKDDALDLCHEMCGRGTASCEMSMELCQYSKKFRASVSLASRCRISRERCHQHRKRVPRQCHCDWDDS